MKMYGELENRKKCGKQKKRHIFHCFVFYYREYKTECMYECMYVCMHKSLALLIKLQAAAILSSFFFLVHKHKGVSYATSIFIHFPHKKSTARQLGYRLRALPCTLYVSSIETTVIIKFYYNNLQPATKTKYRVQ